MTRTRTFIIAAIAFLCGRAAATSPPPQQQDLAARWECQAVMVEGYLVFDAVKEGQEACNCGSTKYVDHHLWLASTPSASRAKAMVVEVSPREWAYHQGWNKAETFRRLIRAKERVRVIGWLTWDQEHAAHLGKYRRILWGLTRSIRFKCCAETSGSPSNFIMGHCRD